jgi:hypothetical protein
MLPSRYKTAFTCAAASTTGYKSNATGATWALTATTANDGLAHKVTIANDSATDHSAKTAVITGTDANGNAQTETVNLPAASPAVVTSTKFFLTVTSIVPSATIGADTMDLGWTAAAVSPWVKLDSIQNGFGVSVAVAVGGTINYDVEHTYDLLDGAATAFKHSGITGATASDDGQYIAPVQGVRVNVNSHTSGTFTFYVLQGDRS